MEAKTHITTSLTLAAGISKYLALPFTVGYLAGTVLGSVLPDIDKKDSFIGQRSLGISHLVQMLFGHRGFTHSVLCWVIISIICLNYPSAFTYGLLIGYIGHIIGDFFSNRGVPILYPIIKKPFSPPSFLTYRTSSTSESIIFVSSIVILLIMVLDDSLIDELVHSIEQLVSRF
ncbi:metal-dependent hydrolase [Piscibacillus halophilus]|uniref:Inner membrane protein n=1 Tax=Piscibacillus halophilus TaxID=571933 RepID=A0A1H9HGL4_9BACI|nr:metal-dependent hydrolase [Piscibacillus halophilus]SEQ61428.1 inner membrane protein [Piscibacillus halophilus]